jgi:mannosylglycerate hydrolase
VAGFGRIVDDGDAGDTYNWSPPADGTTIDRPDDVDVLVTEAGPVRGRIEITRRYRWPTRIDGGRRSAPIDVFTPVVELRAGEDLVRVSVRFDNRCRDHRVRMWFPLPEPTDRSPGRVRLHHRPPGLTAEGGPNEVGLPTFPSRRFVRGRRAPRGPRRAVRVRAGRRLERVTRRRAEPTPVLGRSLAITLLRCVGVISQGPMAMRALPAGPRRPPRGADARPVHEAELVLHTGGRDPYAVVDEAFTPLLTARFPGGRPGATPTGRAAPSP